MNEIGLQEVIYQVKRELLEANQAAQARDPYPLFVIEKIDLEIATRITRAADGSIKLTILEVAEFNAGRSTSVSIAQPATESLTRSKTDDLPTLATTTEDLVCR